METARSLSAKAAWIAEVLDAGAIMTGYAKKEKASALNAWIA